MSCAPMGFCNGAVAVLRQMENIPLLEAMTVISTFIPRHRVLACVSFTVIVFVTGVDFFHIPLYLAVITYRMATISVARRRRVARGDF
jgi:hypothetical protein